MALVELRDIRKSFNLGGEPVEILHGVNLKVDKGEFVAMMGPSGSGKSTTMNILGCLDRPTSGEYLLDGVNVEDMDSDELAHIRNSMIGFVFQGFNLLSKTSALENVELPLLYAGVPRAQRHEKAKAALIEMGLSERLYHEPSQLSGGQQQRRADGKPRLQDERRNNGALHAPQRRGHDDNPRHARVRRRALRETHPPF